MNANEIKREKKLRRAERGGLMAVMLLICAVFLLFVGLNAQSSKLKYDINQLNKQISEVEKGITNLEVQIKSASNITSIEKKALAMGMIYPDVDQIVYIQGDSGIEGFALALMESVYQ